MRLSFETLTKYKPGEASEVEELVFGALHDYPGHLIREGKPTPCTAVGPPVFGDLAFTG
jgi:hypothetical protein